MTAPVSEERIPARVIEVEALSSTVRRIVLSPELSSYSWRAGQHVAIRRQRERGPDSYYSFASAHRSPGDPRFELAVSSVPSATIGELTLGDRVWLSPARGTVILKDLDAGRPLLLVGMGTGVAPLRATVQELRAGARKGALTLLHGCRSEADRLFAEEFTESSAELGWSYSPVLSRASEGWAGLKGYVQDHLNEHLAEDVFCVICGSLAMVTDITQLLLARGIPRDQFIAEGY